MKKLILCASLVAMAMLSSCEKELLVPEGTKPEWLGESIYEELRSGTHLEGTFNTYLRLVDDLKYDEILSRTGSKTIFPANDEAFERFFADSNNPYGVTCYEELQEGMKRQLLKASMLDNALLAGMLSNTPRQNDDNNVDRGKAIKHETNISVTDSVTYIGHQSLMPQNNPYWSGHNEIYVVSDATKPMMVHFTREQMLANNITTTGSDSDFGILRGEPVGSEITNSDTAYIYQTKIIKQDVTCLNGYIHQVADVLVPPGNVAQVLRAEQNTKLFSRILDYFCAPYFDAAAQRTTRDYNDWALQNGKPIIDSIYQIRYFSTRSQGGAPNVLDPIGTQIPNNKRLKWDPGWNQYYSSTNTANSLDDIGAILVPTDDAIKDYFLPGGGGAYFIDLYGVKGLLNTEDNLVANLDALHNNGNGILTSFVNNLMQTSFVATVPSKFGTITNDGSGDFMGITKDDISKTRVGNELRYDVKVANNGVIYKLDKMVAPDEFQSVIGPALVYPDLSIMGYFSQDKTTGTGVSIFGADMYYYLMAMKANYIYFIPSNEGLKGCFIDPVSLKTSTPSALEFYFHVDSVKGTTTVQNVYGVKIHDYDPETGEISPEIREDVPNIVDTKTTPATSPYASQVYDMLNYNTIVLDAGEQITNNYYLTKHGGAVKLSEFKEVDGVYSGYVSGGAQIDNGVAPAKIEMGWKEKNGWAFRLDNVIQPALISVRKLLDNNKDRFQSFIDLCAVFNETSLLGWAGIKSSSGSFGTSPQQRYFVFTDKEGKALDMNVNFFNGYNYTLYAPDNEAMEIAKEMGLPTVEEIMSEYNKYKDAISEDDLLEGEEADENVYPADTIDAAKKRTLAKLNAVRAFIRYHFQNNSVFADNDVKETEYQSLYSTELGIPTILTTKSKDGKLTVKDEFGQEIEIYADDNQRLVNKMTRDYEYDDAVQPTSIAVSSFAVVHQVSKPLCHSKSGRYDDAWKK